MNTINMQGVNPVDVASAKRAADTGKQAKVRSVANALAKLDTVLVGKRVDVATSNFSDNKTEMGGGKRKITLQEDLVLDAFDSARAQMILKGINYHEVAHLLFTPKRVGYLGVGSTWTLGWNILEDGRVERLFSSRYQSTRALFRRAVLDKAISEQQQAHDPVTAWAIAASRSFLLSDKVLAEVRRVTTESLKALWPDRHPDWEIEADFGRLKVLAEEYRGLVLNRASANQAACIVGEFNQILDKYLAQGDDVNRSPEGDADDEDQEQAQQEASDAEGTQDDSGDAEESEQGADTSEDESEPQRGSGEAQSDNQGDESEESEESDSGEGDTSEADEDEETDSSGSGQAESDASPDAQDDQTDGSGTEDGDDEPADLNEELAEAEGSYAESLSEFDDAVKDEYQALRHKAVIKESGLDSDQAWGHAENYRTTDGRMTQHVSNVVRAFEHAQAEKGAGWNRRVDMGKPNMAAMIESGHLPDLDVFDQYEDLYGDQTDLAVEVLADISGSMMSSGQALSKALWIMNRAALGADVDINTGAFTSRHFHLDRSSFARSNSFRVLKPSGGTCGADSMAIATARLLKSDAENKLITIMTDGDFADVAQVKGAIAYARSEGIEVQVVHYYSVNDRYAQTVLAERGSPFQGIASHILTCNDLNVWADWFCDNIKKVVSV